MSKTVMIRARIEPELKEEVETVLKKIGLSASEAINMFYRHIEHRKALPFDAEIPNRTTRRAFKLSEKNKGITHYKNPKEIFDKLGI